MSTHSELAGYLQQGYPRWVESESQRGNEYLYRYPSASLTKPEVGDVWADSRTLTSVDETPLLDGSSYNELRCSTVRSFSGGGASGSTLEDTSYQLRWFAKQLPLVQHPQFVPGGTSDLYSNNVTYGGVTAKPKTHLAEWENEPNQTVKWSRSYNPKLPDGTPSGAAAVTIDSGAALAYIKLRELGFDSFDVYLPVWSKVSIYSGVTAPDGGDLGEYVAGTSVPGPLPTALEGYEYIKTQDDVERVGEKAKWRRTEAWTGYPMVFFDKDSLNPADHTIP